MEHREDGPPKPAVKKRRGLRRLVWMIPLCAAAAAAYYARDRFESSGPLITIEFPDVPGLRVGDTLVLHRGIEIGKVVGAELSARKSRALVRVRLQRGQEAFAAEGASFWLVGPDVSEAGFTGVNTLFSGPYIDSIPGAGEAKAEFVALRERPKETGGELHLVLQAPRLQGLRAGAPVSFRGVETGYVRDVRLSRSADSVEVRLVVWKRYRPLVRARTRFWAGSGFDVKGGLLSGLEVKLQSLKKLVSGEISFATPDKDMGPAAKDGARFALEDQVPKGAPGWAPRIAIEPVEAPAEPEPSFSAEKDLLETK